MARLFIRNLFISAPVAIIGEIRQRYFKRKSPDVEAAVELSLENNLSSSQGVLHLLIYANDRTNVAAPLNGWESLPAPDLDQYGQLGGVQ